MAPADGERKGARIERKFSRLVRVVPCFDHLHVFGFHFGDAIFFSKLIHKIFRFECDRLKKNIHCFVLEFEIDDFAIFLIRTTFHRDIASLGIKKEVKECYSII